MRSSVRKFMGVVLIAMLGVLALPMLAAGAQTNGSSGSNGVPPDPPGDCNVTSVTPNPVPAAGTQVTISGTAPAEDNLTVVLFDNGVPAVPSPGDKVTQLVTDGTFSLLYTIQQDTNLSVNFTFGNNNAYTSSCIFPGGEVVVRVTIAVKPAEATKPAAAAAALAFTGSSDTPSYVLIGIAAIVVGAVLVVAARRRSHLS